jgi:hypothetical protein
MAEIALNCGYLASSLKQRVVILLTITRIRNLISSRAPRGVSKLQLRN